MLIETVFLEAKSANIFLAGEADEIETQKILLLTANTSPSELLDQEGRDLRNADWAVWIERKGSSTEARGETLGKVVHATGAKGSKLTVTLEVTDKTFDALLSAIQTAQRELDLTVTFVGPDAASLNGAWNTVSASTLSVTSYDFGIALPTTRRDA